MKTQDFTLPAHWASYFINADPSGLEDEELLQVQAWERDNAPGPCLDVSDDVEILRTGDDGGPMAERCVFTFQVLGDQ